MEKMNIKPLDKIQAGALVRIATIDAGRGLKNRLAAMGLLANVQIRVVRNDGAGQIIVNVKNSKVILGRGMSHKVFVTVDGRGTTNEHQYNFDRINRTKKSC